MRTQPKITNVRQGRKRRLAEGVDGYEWITFTADFSGPEGDVLMDWQLADRPLYKIEGRIVLTESGTYDLNSVTITQREGGPAVTADGIRTVPTQSIVLAVINEYGCTFSGTSNAESGAAIRKRGTTDDMALRAVTTAYALALVSGGNPVEAVADRLECSYPTASRWVAAAKRRGYIRDSERGWQKRVSYEIGEPRPIKKGK